jgi:hypothetical protein
LGEPDRYGLFTPTSAGIRTVHAWGAIKDSGLETRTLETSIRTLSRLLPRNSEPEEVFPGVYSLERLAITCEHPEDVKVWLQEVSLHLTLHRSDEADL